MCSEKRWMINCFLFFSFAGVAHSVHLEFYKGYEIVEILTIKNITALLNSPYFSPEKRTVFYVFDVNDTANGSSVQRMVKSAADTDRANLLILEWEIVAKYALEKSYADAVSAAIMIGKLLGIALVELDAAGLPASSLHLFGSGLGGQMLSFTGREVQRHNLNIGRLTGLDPSGSEYDAITNKHLDASCATFVDVIHTNPGQIGTSKSVASVDIWPNCGSSLQPGCEEDTDPNECSHDFAWRYFGEASERDHGLRARYATSCDSWKAGNGTNETIYLGSPTDTKERGNFFLRTNAVPPYGLFDEGLNPV